MFEPHPRSSNPNLRKKVRPLHQNIHPHTLGAPSLTIRSMTKMMMPVRNEGNDIIAVEVLSLVPKSMLLLLLLLLPEWKQSMWLRIHRLQQMHCQEWCSLFWQTSVVNSAFFHETVCADLYKLFRGVHSVHFEKHWCQALGTFIKLGGNL